MESGTNQRPGRHSNTVEVNFDGIVGPTHNFAGLSPGNVASTENDGTVSNPREAALEGLRKMRALRDLGVPQAVLPPAPRPHLATLKRLGFDGRDEEVLARAHATEPYLLRLASSASAMWAANAATVAPSADTVDHRLHLVVANLGSMFHRSLEPSSTREVLRAIFSDAGRFEVHDALPQGALFSDEGAANHTRLEVEDRPAAHLFAWGRATFARAGDGLGPTKFPARQTREASEAVARLLALRPDRTVFARQHPEGIDRGAFHTDVLAVGHEDLLLMHELAFADAPALLAQLREKLGEGLTTIIATNAELPVEDAVKAYPFNSQLITTADGSRAIVAPRESETSRTARAFLERVQAEGAIRRIVYLDVRQSMRNGGGPACLRLRVGLRASDLTTLAAHVMFTDALEAELVGWVERHYRDRLLPGDLADPSLHRESMQALDEITRILRLGTVYDFQS